MSFLQAADKLWPRKVDGVFMLKSEIPLEKWGAYAVLKAVSDMVRHTLGKTGHGDVLAHVSDDAICSYVAGCSHPHSQALPMQLAVLQSQPNPVRPDLHNTMCKAERKPSHACYRYVQNMSAGVRNRDK